MDILRVGDVVRLKKVAAGANAEELRVNWINHADRPATLQVVDPYGDMHLFEVSLLEFVRHAEHVKSWGDALPQTKHDQIRDGANHGLPGDPPPYSMRLVKAGPDGVEVGQPFIPAAPDPWGADKQPPYEPSVVDQMLDAVERRKELGPLSRAWPYADEEELTIAMPPPLKPGERSLHERMLDAVNGPKQPPGVQAAESQGYQFQKEDGRTFATTLDEAPPARTVGEIAATMAARIALKVGDTVVLKSGGPKLTVIELVGQTEVRVFAINIDGVHIDLKLPMAAFRASHY